MLGGVGIHRRFTWLGSLTMQTYNPLIAYHSRKDNTGWREECRQYADWDGWHPCDKSMIDELLKTGDLVLTLGWNMYQVVIESV
jgi:hypothetical protein